MIGYRKCYRDKKRNEKENREQFGQGEEEKKRFSSGVENMLRGKEVIVLDGVDMRVVMNE